MKTKKIILFITIIFISAGIKAQNKSGIITGAIKDRTTQELLIGASVMLEGTNLGAQTDAEGRFKISGIPPKTYNLKVNYMGYKSKTLFNLVVTTGNIINVSIEIDAENKNLNEVVIQQRSFGKKTETPLSVQSLTQEEIKSNPGGNFDISRVIQALPGVGGSTGGAAFRNDIIIRGGGPGENVFFLDGIEIPVINHFTTQGSTGGPQGILNVSFIEDVTLNSSSFGSKYDNALSSVIVFKQKDGNTERVQGNARLSASEFGITLDGPLTKNTTFLASARRSYLQFLFQALDIPIRPNYWDFQYKTTTKLNDKTTLTTLGVGAIDEFSFAVPKESSPEKEYNLRSNPIINQWNYTIGSTIKRRINNGVLNIALSRNMFENRLDRFEDAQFNNENARVLKLVSRETENKLRLDVNKYSGKFKYSYGGVLQYVKFSNEGFARIKNAIKGTNGLDSVAAINAGLNSAIEFFRYGFFAEANRLFLQNRLNLTVGIRADGNTFTNTGNDIYRTLSPRVAASYALTEKWNINATAGRYYRLPIYTVLGYKNRNGELPNTDNEYIAVNHFVAGLEFLPTNVTRITVEGFFKQYSNYAVSDATGISLANQGTEFGAIGNERTISSGNGRAYGFEIFLQQKLVKNIFTTISYTFFYSKFSGKDGKYVSSAWDNRHLLSAILGYKFKRGWEIGLKHRFAGGSPYTPFDIQASTQNYLLAGTGTLDFGNLNSLRLGSFNQTDIRIDKKINFKRLTLDIFFDIQNFLRSKNPAVPNFTFLRNADNTGWATLDGLPVKTDGSNATPVILPNSNDTFLPTFGFIVEF